MTGRLRIGGRNGTSAAPRSTTTIDHKYLEILFETAWSAPVPILLKICEMFPKLTFDCRWRYEDEDPYPNSLEDYYDTSEEVEVDKTAKAGAA